MYQFYLCLTEEVSYHMDFKDWWWCFEEMAACDCHTSDHDTLWPWYWNLLWKTTGFWSRSSSVNNIISRVYQALYMVSQPWHREPHVAHIVQKGIIISGVIINIALHLSSSLCRQHMGEGAGSSAGTVTAPHLYTSCTQAALKHQPATQC